MRSVTVLLIRLKQNFLIGSNKVNIGIVGGDGVVGAYLGKHLEASGFEITLTSRRTNRLAPLKFFDLEDSAFEDRIWEQVGLVVLLAGINDYRICREDCNSDLINCYYVPEFVKKCLLRGKRVIYVSSNSIFDGSFPMPEPHHQPTPRIDYARQKYTTERMITGLARQLDALDRLAIVRLSKIITAKTAPINRWVETLTQPDAMVEAFSDFVVSPISLGYVAERLTETIMCWQAGIYHFSGDQDVSYYELAVLLAERLEQGSACVINVDSSAKGFAIEFKPKFSGLMSGFSNFFTQESARLPSCSVERVIDEIVIANG